MNRLKSDSWGWRGPTRVDTPLVALTALVLRGRHRDSEEDDRGKNISKHQQARIYEAEMLVRQGLTLREVGRRLNPPVTPQRTWQLLKIGVDLGMFQDPREQRKAEIRKATLPVHERPAPRVQVDPVQRRLERTARLRQRVIEEYKEVVARIGRNPNTADLGRCGLRARIYQHFNLFWLFLNALGERPSYVKASWIKREVQRKNRKTKN